MSEKPLIGIIMGSDTDLPVMAEAAQTLKKFGIPYEIDITSAHRSPGRTSEYARTAVERGLRVIIVGAGGAAVVGVPMATTSLAGLDALLATVQMPGGVPVACTAIGKPGAINAAIFAAQIIATSDAGMARKLVEYKEQLARSVAEKSEKLKREFQL
jgi:5-(carboxyamino)imidazole ribonucleotide mutase